MFVRNASAEILGLPLPDVCFLLACLPVCKGGLGNRDPALVLGPTLIASNFTFAGSQGECGAAMDEPLAVDVGVVHTLQSSVLIADVQPGQVVKKMERRKVMERQALCRRSGWSFSSFAMENIGVWGSKANHLLQKLVTIWANSNGCTKGEAALLCSSRLRLALLRGQARQLERGFPLPQPQSVAEECVDLFSL